MIIHRSIAVRLNFFSRSTPSTRALIEQIKRGEITRNGGGVPDAVKRQREKFRPYKVNDPFTGEKVDVKVSGAGLYLPEEFVVLKYEKPDKADEVKLKYFIKEKVDINNIQQSDLNEVFDKETSDEKIKKNLSSILPADKDYTLKLRIEENKDIHKHPEFIEIWQNDNDPVSVKGIGVKHVKGNVYKLTFNDKNRDIFDVREDYLNQPHHKNDPLADVIFYASPKEKNNVTYYWEGMYRGINRKHFPHCYPFSATSLRWYNDDAFLKPVEEWFNYDSQNVGGTFEIDNNDLFLELNYFKAHPYPSGYKSVEEVTNECSYYMLNNYPRLHAIGVDISELPDKDDPFKSNGTLYSAWERSSKSNNEIYLEGFISFQSVPKCKVIIRMFYKKSDSFLSTAWEDLKQVYNGDSSVTFFEDNYHITPITPDMIKQDNRIPIPILIANNNGIVVLDHVEFSQAEDTPCGILPEYLQAP